LYLGKGQNFFDKNSSQINNIPKILTILIFNILTRTNIVADTPIYQTSITKLTVIIGQCRGLSSAVNRSCAD
jgi:hypothetical protein